MSKWEEIKERREKVKALVNRGFSARRVSEVLKVSMATVWADLKSLSISLKERRAITPTDKQDEAAALRHIGYNLREIGETMGCTPENARRHLLEYEKKLKKRSQ